MRYSRKQTHEPGQAIHVEKPLETSSSGPKIEWSGASGNHQGRENSVSQVDGVSDMVPTLCRGELIKETMVSASTSIWDKTVPSPFTLMLDNSVPPCVSLMPFEMLFQCWNLERVSPNKSVCRTFKRNFLGLQKPSVSLSLSSSWVF